MKTYDHLPSSKQDVLNDTFTDETAAYYGRLHTAAEALNQENPEVMSAIATRANVMFSEFTDDSPRSVLARDTSWMLLWDQARKSDGRSPAKQEPLRLLGEETHLDDMLTLRASLASIAATRPGMDPIESLRIRSTGAKYAREEVATLDPGSDGYFHQAYSAYLAAILSERPVAIRKVRDSLQNIVSDSAEVVLYIDETNKELGKNSDHLHDWLQNPGSVAALDAYRRASFARALSNQLNSALEDPDKTQKLRNTLIGYADAVVFNPDIAEAVDQAFTHEANEIERLSFEVLPPGELQTFAREVVSSRQQERKKPVIDLDRLQILENVRAWWTEQHGAGVAYYSKGIRTSRRIVRDGEREQPDEYILLILKEQQPDGTFIEHAIAESPIAGENALYIQRYDTNHWEWQDLMQYPKQDTTAMGARALHHRAPEGTNLVTAMTEKVKYFLTCPEDEFLEGQLDGLKNDGKTPQVRLPRNVTRYLVAQAQAEA